MATPLDPRQLNQARTLTGTIKGGTGNENRHGQGIYIGYYIFYYYIYCSIKEIISTVERKGW